MSLARTDDLVRGTYRLRFDVSARTDFSLLVLFQIGADTYNSTGEKKMAWGNERGVEKEWATQWGGDTYRFSPIECTGQVPWVSLHEAVPQLEEGDGGAWANRGFVIRSWKAQLGGKDVKPWIAERGHDKGRGRSSTLDVVPPPGTSHLQPGDFVEATIEHIIMPQFARQYYGPNKALRNALTKSENTSGMIHREAVGNNRRVEQLSQGTLVRRYPDVCVRLENDQAAFTLYGGQGYIPVTFTHLDRAQGYVLIVDGKVVDQSVHGSDFWQCDYDAATKRWSQTYNIPVSGTPPAPLHFRFAPRR